MNALTARDFSYTSLDFHKPSQSNLHKLHHVASLRGASPADIVFCGALRQQQNYGSEPTALTERRNKRKNLVHQENMCNNSQEFEEILSEQIQVALKSNRNVLEQCRTEFKSEKESPRRLPTRPLFHFARPHSIHKEEREVLSSHPVQKFEQNQSHPKPESPSRQIKSASIRRTASSQVIMPQLVESPVRLPLHKKLTLSPKQIKLGGFKSRNSIAFLSDKARTQFRQTLSALLKGKNELNTKISLKRMNTSRPFSSRAVVKSPDHSQDKSRNLKRLHTVKVSQRKTVDLKRASFFKQKSPSLDSLAERKPEKPRRKIVGLGGLTQCMTSAELRATIARGVKRLATQLSTE